MVDLLLACEPEAAVTALLASLGDGKPTPVTANRHDRPAPSGDKLTVDHMASALSDAIKGRDVSLTHLSLSWNGASIPFHHPLDYLGSDGGGGGGG